MPNERELWILIRAKDLSEKALNSVRKGLEKLEKIAKRIGRAMWTALKKIGEGLKKTGQLILKALIWPIKMAFKLVEKFGAGVIWLGVFAFRKLFIAMGGTWKALGLFAVGLFVAIKGVKGLRKVLAEAKKTFEELDALSIKMGRSLADLSEQLYHMEIPQEVLDSVYEYGRRMDAITRSNEEFLIKIHTHWTDLKNKVWGIIEDMTRKFDEWVREKLPVPLPLFDRLMGNLIELFDEMKEKTKAAVPLEDRISKEIERLTLSRTEYQVAQYRRRYEEFKRLLEKEVGDTQQAEDYKRAYLDKVADAELRLFQGLYAEKARLEGRFTEAFQAELEIQRMYAEEMWGEDGWMVEMHLEGVRARQRAEQMARLGIQEHWQSALQMQRSFVSASETLLTNLFVAGFKGKLDSAKEIFQNFLNEILTAVARFMAKKIIMMFIKFFLGGPVGGVAGGVTPPALGTVGPGTVMPMQRGGIVTRPTMALLGERGPEAVVPLDRGRGRLAGVTNIYIHAVDAKSFEDLVKRSPEAIKTLIGDSVRSAVTGSY